MTLPNEYIQRGAEWLRQIITRFGLAPSDFDSLRLTEEFLAASGALSRIEAQADELAAIKAGWIGDEDLEAFEESLAPLTQPVSVGVPLMRGILTELKRHRNINLLKAMQKEDPKDFTEDDVLREMGNNEELLKRAERSEQHAADLVEIERETARLHVEEKARADKEVGGLTEMGRALLSRVTELEQQQEVLLRLTASALGRLEEADLQRVPGSVREAAAILGQAPNVANVGDVTDGQWDDTSWQVQLERAVAAEERAERAEKRVEELEAESPNDEATSQLLQTIEALRDASEDEWKAHMLDGTAYILKTYVDSHREMKMRIRDTKKRVEELRKMLMEVTKLDPALVAKVHNDPEGLLTSIFEDGAALTQAQQSDE